MADCAKGSNCAAPVVLNPNTVSAVNIAIFAMNRLAAANMREVPADIRASNIRELGIVPTKQEAFAGGILEMQVVQMRVIAG